jgi:hypothetical protein
MKFGCTDNLVLKIFTGFLVQILLVLLALQRNNTENSRKNFPEKELSSHSPNLHIHVSVSDLYIPTIDSAYTAAGK